MRRLLFLFLALTIACNKTQPPKPTPHVLFIGLDGADWHLLDRFMADGTMPNLARIVAEGDKRVLMTQRPPLSPLVWTTMMTGVSPLEHRILDFTRFNPRTHEREPITSDERAVPAIWNMAMTRGRRVDVFGLWATYPAEAISGTMVSDRLFSYQYDEAAPPPGAVSPAEDEAWARGVVDEVTRQVDANTLKRYGAASSGARASLLRRILIETDVIHRLALERIERDDPHLAVVYFQGTDAIGHLFAPDSNGAPRVYFARIDAILGDYARIAREHHAKLIIASDHGFAWDQPSPLSSLSPTTAAKWHREEGIYAEWPRHAGTPNVLEVGQLCSILLDRLGLPTDVREYRRAFHRAQTSTVGGGSEEIAKLKALGYVGAGEPSQGSASSTRTAGSFNNEGLILRNNGRTAEAMTAFENALTIDPKNASTLWNLSDLLRTTHGDAARADDLLERALAIDDTQPLWLLMRGRRRLEKRDCRGARDDFARAAQLGPSPIAFASLGTAESCLGETATAHDHFARSLALDPDQPAVRRFLEAQ